MFAEHLELLVPARCTILGNVCVAIAALCALLQLCSTLYNLLVFLWPNAELIPVIYLSRG